MVLAVAKAAEAGARAIVCASTGNTSASAAAYGAAAGMEVIVVLPKGQIAVGKLLQALIAGARVVAIDGNFDQALGIVRALAEQDDHPVTLVNSVNPFRLEGQKTAAFEICDDLGRAPDVLAIPVGNAGNISAYWAGFRDYAEAGMVASRPAMWGFQAAGAAPIVVGHRIEHPETVATAIRIGDPASWAKAVDARDASRGRIAAVTDDEILASYRALARYEGIFCEPASAAGVAGVTQGGGGRRARPRRDRGLRPDRARPEGSDHGGTPGPAVPRGRADHRRRSPSHSAGRGPPWPTGSRSSTAAGSPSRCPARRPTSGAGYDCLGVALAITDRIEVEVRVWSRGAIELTVEGEGRNELTEDRDNRFVRGLEAVLRAARGELPEGRGLADRDAEPHPAGAWARFVGGGDRRRRAGRERARGRGALDRRAAAHRLRDRGPSRQRGGRPARRVRRVGELAGRRRGDPVRCAARPARRPVHPRAPPADRRRCGRRCRASVPMADAVANLGAVAVGVAGLATGRYDLLARLTVDRLHEPYRATVFPQLPRMVEAARAAGALGRVPVGRRVDDPRLHRFDGRDHPPRGGLLRRGRRYRPGRPRPRGRAAQHAARGWPRGADRWRSGIGPVGRMSGRR